MTGTSCRHCIWLFTRDGVALAPGVHSWTRTLRGVTNLHCAMDRHPDLPQDVRQTWPAPRRRKDPRLDSWHVTRDTRCDQHTLATPGMKISPGVHQEGEYAHMRTTEREAAHALLAHANPVPMAVLEYFKKKGK